MEAKKEHVTMGDKEGTSRDAEGGGESAARFGDVKDDDRVSLSGDSDIGAENESDQTPRAPWSRVCTWWNYKHPVASYVLALWSTLTISALTASGYITAVALIYCGLFVVLVTIRLVTYCMFSRSEFLLDVCYLINCGVIVYVLAIPHSGIMHNVVFITAHTVPVYAVFAYTNALELSEYGQLTSCLIHFGPVFITSLIRWQDANSIYGTPYNRCEDDDPLLCSPWLALGIGCAASVVHAVPYMMITFIGLEQRMRDPGYLNSYLYLASRFEFIIRGWTERSKKICYITVYIATFWILALGAVVAWTYRWVDTGILALMFVGMSINAGIRQDKNSRPPRHKTKTNKISAADDAANDKSETA